MTARLSPPLASTSGFTGEYATDLTGRAVPKKGVLLREGSDRKHQQKYYAEKEVFERHRISGFVLNANIEGGSRGKKMEA